MGFDMLEACPGVFHIRDALNVCMTLICGHDEAVLIDTGYGVENVSAFIHSLTNLPLTVLLTHGHHDHALGSMWFDKIQIHSSDLPVYQIYTDIKQRKKVTDSAAEHNISADFKSYLKHPVPKPEPIRQMQWNLGGLTLDCIPCPGHTPGSMMYFIREYKLLLTGDNWNPCTWLFFPEALGLQSYQSNMESALRNLDFQHVLCSHRFRLYDRDIIDGFLNGLPDACMHAVPTDEGKSLGIDTCRCEPCAGQILVFDMRKAT